MYRLMVSRDSGCLYLLYDQDESLEELVKRATKYDEQGLLWIIRKYDEQGLLWIISDESGKSVEFSQVYIDFVVRKFHDTRSGY